MSEANRVFRVVMEMILLVRSMLAWILLAVFFGCMGHFAAIGIPVFSVLALLSSSGLIATGNVPVFLVLLTICCVLRGPLKYGEQLCNHYVAFRTLEYIRSSVFARLRDLAPSCYERDSIEGPSSRGDLVSMITSDIELMEVFYAHTLSPICIALFVSLAMVGFCYSVSWLLGLCSFVVYCCIGVLVPIVSSNRIKETGYKCRKKGGVLMGKWIETIQGLDELKACGYGMTRLGEMMDLSDDIENDKLNVRLFEGKRSAVTDCVMYSGLCLFLFIGFFEYSIAGIQGSSIVIATVAFASSFAPTLALMALSSELPFSLASGKRVIALMREKPVVRDVTGQYTSEFGTIDIKNVCFSFRRKPVLDNTSCTIQEKAITAIYGASGCGKTTLLKLLMRFWPVQEGKILIGRKKIDEINTVDLRRMEAYMEQDTFIFSGSLQYNITLGNVTGNDEAVMEAVRKASLLEFVDSHESGLNTIVGKGGICLSGGERQRVGLARAFYHGAPLLLLDEPTSNLDSLNEGTILMALQEHARDRTIIIVSHRRSTLNIADCLYEM